MVSQILANTLYQKIEFFMYGSYTILSRGEVELTLTIESYKSGQTRSFSARGNIREATQLLAQKLFDFFQSNKYAEWLNPQANLEWIPAPKDQPKAIAASVRLFCRNQNARIPYARELVLASQGSQYRAGGITALMNGEIFVVADRQRWTARSRMA